MLCLGNKNSVTGHRTHKSNIEHIMQRVAVTGKRNGVKGELFSIQGVNTRFTRRINDYTSLSLFLQ